MDHPLIERTMRTGYPFPIKEVEDKSVGTDALGNEVFEGDLILVLEDEFFLKEELVEQSIELLETLGATEKIA